MNATSTSFDTIDIDPIDTNTNTNTSSAPPTRTAATTTTTTSAPPTRTAATTDDTESEHYDEPGWFTRAVFNRIVALSTRCGLSVRGSRVLAVRGRSSGQIRTTPVSVLTVDGRRYLVAPRGGTQWVRNLRVARNCDLRLGRRVETVAAVELADADKPAVLRPYLRRWNWEVGQFFDGVGPDASDDELLAAAPNHPVFRISTAG